MQIANNNCLLDFCWDEEVSLRLLVLFFFLSSQLCLSLSKNAIVGRYHTHDHYEVLPACISEPVPPKELADCVLIWLEVRATHARSSNQFVWGIWYVCVAYGMLFMVIKPILSWGMYCVCVGVFITREVDAIRYTMAGHVLCASAGHYSCELAPDLCVGGLIFPISCVRVPVYVSGCLRVCVFFHSHWLCRNPAATQRCKRCQVKGRAKNRRINNFGYGGFSILLFPILVSFHATLFLTYWDAAVSVVASHSNLDVSLMDVRSLFSNLNFRFL